MTSLFVFVFLIGGSTDGGAATQVHETRFKDYAACEAAADKLGTSSQLWDNRYAQGGKYKILAVCVNGKA